MSDDNTLWSVHVQGGDEWHACASKELAESLTEQLNDYDAKMAAKFGSDGLYLRPVVKPWPYEAAAHALELVEDREAFGASQAKSVA